MKVAVVGAGGYAGAELCRLLSGHPRAQLCGMFVSAGSQDHGRALGDLYGALRGRVPGTLQRLEDARAVIAAGAEAVFLATDHKVSYQLAPELAAAGLTVFDLSGAYRIPDPAVFARYYGFAHEQPELLAGAVYGLAEWVTPAQLRATALIALPGCYPTAAQLALRPLADADLLAPEFPPIINAVSGVSGAGRAVKPGSQFCAVSLQPYGLFTHRHRPEIELHLGREVIFTPHLAAFRRGIYETIYVRLRAGITGADLRECWARAYAGRPLVRLCPGMPQLQDVQGLPFCDLGCEAAPPYAVLGAAEDNLLKGAAAQAVQILNLRCGFPETEGLL